MKAKTGLQDYKVSILNEDNVENEKWERITSVFSG